MTNVKLKDIAQHLGVSTVTVSNALSGKKGVSEELRGKILQAARQMGYDMKRYELSEDSYMIGVIVNYNYLGIGTSFYWALYQQLAFAALKNQNLTMLESVEDVQQNKGTLPQMIRENKVDGLIVIGWMKESYIRKVVKEAGVPVVFLDFNLSEVKCDAVLSSNYIGMYKVTRYLVEHGHRKIAFLGSVKENDNVLDRYYGYRKGLMESGIEPQEKWKIGTEDLQKESFWENFSKDMPTAVACFSDYHAGKLYDGLQMHGYRVPEDISVASYDDYLFGHSFAQQLTSYHVDMKSMAETAVKMLQNRIRGSNKSFEVRYIDSNITERSSVRKI